MNPEKVARLANGVKNLIGVWDGDLSPEEILSGVNIGARETIVRGFNKIVDVGELSIKAGKLTGVTEGMGAMIAFEHDLRLAELSKGK